MEAPNFQALVDRAYQESTLDYNTVYNKILRQYPNKQAPTTDNKQRLAPKPTGVCRNGKKLTLVEAINGANAVLKDIRGEVVDNQQIAARAAVCKMCPELAKASDCMVCRAGAALVNGVNFAKRLVGRDLPRIPEDMKSKFCCACGCSHMVTLSSKVENFKDADQRPAHCWVVTEQAALSKSLS